MGNEIDTTDQELVAAARLDARMFSAIVNRYEVSIRRYVRRLGCEDGNDAEDVLQEIFIKVFLNLNDYDVGLKFSSWLYRIAHNEAISFFRKKNARPGVLPLSLEDTEEFFAQLADDEDFVEQARQRDDARVVRDLLSRLDPKYRDTLVLRFLEEKSYTEIGDILKIPEGTVATLISRGKRALKFELEARGIRRI